MYKGIDKEAVPRKIVILRGLLQSAPGAFFRKKSGFFRKTYAQKVRGKIVDLAEKVAKTSEQPDYLRLIDAAIKHAILSKYDDDFLAASMKLFSKDMEKLKKAHKEYLINEYNSTDDSLDRVISEKFSDKMNTASDLRASIKKRMRKNRQSWTKELDRDTEYKIIQRLTNEFKKITKRRIGRWEKRTAKNRAKKAAKAAPTGVTKRRGGSPEARRARRAREREAEVEKSKRESEERMRKYRRERRRW
jgi:hypothetical protein